MVTESAQAKEENKYTRKQSHKNHLNGTKIRIEKQQCKLLKNIHSGNINRRFCYISYYNDKFCVLMSLRTVAMIWLPTTMCGMGACS